MSVCRDTDPTVAGCTPEPSRLASNGTSQHPTATCSNDADERKTCFNAPLPHFRWCVVGHTTVVAKAAADALADVAQDYPGVVEPRPFEVATRDAIHLLPSLAKRGPRYTTATDATPPTPNPVAAASSRSKRAVKCAGAGTGALVAAEDAERKTGHDAGVAATDTAQQAAVDASVWVRHPAPEANDRVYASRKGPVPMYGAVVVPATCPVLLRLRP